MTQTTFEQSSAPAIVTSVGGYGPEHRIDPLAGGEHDRVYNNVGPFVSDIETVHAEWDATQSYADAITESSNPHTVTRRVTRLLTSAGVFAAITTDDTLRGHIEAAIPARNNAWMVYIGENDVDRPHVPVNSDKYRSDIEQVAARGHQSPLESITRALDENVTFYATIDPSWKNQLLDLWGGTFGWSESQINHLVADLEADAQKAPSDRHYWFSATVEDTKLVGVAMAERIDMPHPDEEPIRFVESTEWRRRAGGKSRMDATLSWLHTQILEDIPDAVIYAECNETSGAYNVAHRVHLEDSGSELATVAESEGHVAFMGIKNVLKANVYVDDDVEPLTPRNFVVMYLSEANKQTWYNASTRTAIGDTIRQRQNT